MIQERAQDLLADLMDIARYTCHIAAHTDIVDCHATVLPLFDRLHVGLPGVDLVDWAMYAHRSVARKIGDCGEITTSWATITAEPCLECQQAGNLLIEIGASLNGEVNVSFLDERLTVLRTLLFS